MIRGMNLRIQKRWSGEEGEDILVCQGSATALR